MASTLARILAAALLGCSAAASAATFTVNRTTDAWDGSCDAHCTLRDAVQAANDAPGADVIQLAVTTYKLTLPPPVDSESNIGDEDENRNGDLDITGELTIKGHTGGTYVDGRGLTRIVEVLAGANVELRDLKLRNGNTPARGGAVANAGTLRMVRVDARLNTASSSHDLGQGGAVFNDSAGILSIADSHFQLNRAGGGAASHGEGGAVYNLGRLNVRTTGFVDNRSGDGEDVGGGGAIMNRVGFATIERCYFVRNSTMSEGQGGAIANRESGRLRLANSTVSANISGTLDTLGGAVANGTPFEVPGRMTLSFNTIAGNQGGGLFVAGEATTAHNIIGGNYERVGDARDYNAGSNCVVVGAVTDTGSVVGLDGNCPYRTGILNHEIFTVLLRGLADNGGFGLTHALRRTSDHAIDRVAPFEACPAVDQRGAPRPVDGDGRDEVGCDVGAYEVQVIDD
ncbi:MAG TPA: CSLREA domain-containing protein [Verrucomicrobiae bacterium]|nr:CSLREA domain-containing protein [Verrucomicrobiae bacterium]